MLPVQNITCSINGLALPVLYRPVKNPGNRPLLFCIHGGSYTGHYFNFASQPETSLFAVAGALGYPIMAITRPGYEIEGADCPSFEDQAAILAAATSNLRNEHLPLAKICLIGHSIGAQLALMMAVNHDIAGLATLDISGYGLHYHDHAQRGFAKFLAMDSPPLAPNADARARRMFGPPATYDPQVLAEDIATAPSTRMGDMAGLLDMEGMLGYLAPMVTLPVHFTLAEHDALWVSTPEEFQAVQNAFSQAPQTQFRIHPHAGHCLHLHKNARAAHLSTLAFIEQYAAT